MEGKKRKLQGVALPGSPRRRAIQPGEWYLTTEEVARLIASLDPEVEKERKALLAIKLLYWCALRASELRRRIFRPLASSPCAPGSA